MSGAAAPPFSIVVPTLRRPDTLEHALRTVLWQTEADFEVVVQNNGNDPETRALIERLDDPRVRHVGSEQVLFMSENWERALANARGEWITFLGDDDGLLPDACEIAAEVVGSRTCEIVSWTPFLYHWPRYFEESLRNRLEGVVDFRFEVAPVASKALLRRFYSFDAHYSRLPMIYNSFVHRSLIERVVARHGKYFLGSSPDVTSGIVNAASTASFLKTTRPLSVSGVSQHSTGHNTFLRDDAELEQANLLRDFAPGADGVIVDAASNLELFIAVDMLRIQSAFPGELASLEFSYTNLVRAVAANINARPTRYEETRALVGRLAERFGVDPAEIPIPARLGPARVEAFGSEPVGPYEARFTIDGDVLSLESVADAARVVSQLVPRAGLLDLVERADDGAVPQLGSGPLTFAKAGNGLGALESGWAEPEDWGTWSLGREAVLRVGLPAGDGRPARLALRYRTIPFEGPHPRIVECRAGGLTTTWSFDRENHAGEAMIDLGTAEGEVEIRLVNVDPRSPAELGLSRDSRQIGIGVEQLRAVTEV